MWQAEVIQGVDPVQGGRTKLDLLCISTAPRLDSYDFMITEVGNTGSLEHIKFVEFGRGKFVVE